MPSEVSVTPSCIAVMKRGGSAVIRSTRAARRSPCWIELGEPRAAHGDERRTRPPRRSRSGAISTATPTSSRKRCHAAGPRRSGGCRESEESSNGLRRSIGAAPEAGRQGPPGSVGGGQLAGTATRFAGTICGWYANTSRLVGSTSTFSQCTSLLPFSWWSPNVSTRVKFSSRWPERVLERLVDAEVVRVAVHVGDRLLEGDRPRRAARQVVLEAVGLAVGLGERLRVAQRRPRDVAQVPAGIGLRDEHDRDRAVGLRRRRTSPAATGCSPRSAPRTRPGRARCRRGCCTSPGR